MNCSQNGYETAATQGHLGSVGMSSSTGSRRNDAFKQDSVIQQARSIALHAEETVDQIQETLAKSLSTQDQATAAFEQFKVEVLAALSDISRRLDFIERHFGLKSAPAADLGNSGGGHASTQCAVPTTVMNGAALRNNKLIKPSAPAVPALATFPESGQTVPSSSQILSKAGVENQSGTGKVSLPTSHMKPETVESGSPGKEKGAAGTPLSTAALRDKFRSLSSRTQTLVKPNLSSQEKGTEVVKLQIKSLPVQASTSSSNSATAPANDVVDGREAIAPINLTTSNIHPKSVMVPPPSSTSTGLSIPARPLNIADLLPRMVKPSAIPPSQTTGRFVLPPLTDIDSAKAAIGKLLVSPSEFEEVSAATLKLLPVLKEDALRELVICIFATFAKDSMSASFGGKLCKNLSEHPTCGTRFRNLLIERSQKEFINVVDNIGRGTDSSVEKRTPGLIWFLGEIYMMINVRKIDRFERIFLLALATVELINILLGITGACHLRANIQCALDVLKHMKPCLVTDGVVDEGIVKELDKLGQQCKRLETSGASSLNAELKQTLQSTYLQIKLMMIEVARAKTAKRAKSVSSPPTPK